MARRGVVKSMRENTADSVAAFSVHTISRGFSQSHGACDMYIGNNIFKIKTRNQFSTRVFIGHASSVWLSGHDDCIPERRERRAINTDRFRKKNALENF